LEVDPDMDDLRDKPRFVRMLAETKERLAAAAADETPNEMPRVV
jgi:hypothetical protein